MGENKFCAIVPEASAGAEKLSKSRSRKTVKDHKVSKLRSGKGDGTSVVNFPNKTE